MKKNEKELTIARLECMPEHIRIAVLIEKVLDKSDKKGLGHCGKTFDKNQLIKEVKNETEFGERIVEVEMNYLRSFREMN